MVRAVNRYQWMARSERAAALPNLLSSILDIEDTAVRDTLLHTQLLRRVMMRPASVGGWLVVRLRSPPTRASAIDYLEIVSRENAAADEHGFWREFEAAKIVRARLLWRRDGDAAERSIGISSSGPAQLDEAQIAMGSTLSVRPSA